MNKPPGCCSRSPRRTKRCTSPRGLLRVPSSAAPAPQAPPPRQPSPGWAPRTFAEMKFGAPRAATSCRRREGCCCFPRAGAEPSPQPRAPSGGAARAPRGAACKPSLAPAGLLLPSPAPSLALAGHCLRAPAPGPAARPRPSPRPLAPTQSFGGGGKCPGAGRPAAAAQDARVPSVFLKSTLPAAAAAPTAESLGLQPGCSQVSRKTESERRAPAEGCGWGAPTSRARQA